MNILIKNPQKTFNYNLKENIQNLVKINDCDWLEC